MSDKAKLLEAAVKALFDFQGEDYCTPDQYEKTEEARYIIQDLIDNIKGA